MTMEIEEDFTQDPFSGGLDISQLCRICANPNDYLIPIFEGEGLEHELKSKITKHLPIKVSESDKLPTQVCYQCASTLIAWHDLVVACIDAEETFNSLFKEDGQPIVRIKTETIKDRCNSNYNTQNQPVGVSEQGGINQEDSTEDVAENILIGSPDDHENIIIEEVKTMVSETSEDVPSDSRCVAPFNAYLQTQTALRKLEWVSSGCMFCILCGKLKRNHTILIKHISMEHTIRCGHCRASFVNEDQLSAHMIVHDCNKVEMGNIHNVYKNIQTKILNSQIKYRRIIVKKKPNNEYLLKKVSNKCPFQCNICLTQFPRRFDMKKHKLKHHSIVHSSENEKSNILSHSCEVMLSNPKEGRQNIRNIQEMNGKSDKECDLSYSDDSVNSEEISRHLDVKSESGHDSVKIVNHKYSCSDCNISFKTKQKMLAHQQTEHTIQQLEAEGKSNGRKRFPNKQFSCSLCRNLYSRSSDLQKHICKKHGGNKVIRRCVDYVDDMDVEIINQAKQDVGGTVVYRCNYCDKNMRTRRGFVRHIRIHTGERPFTCHMCGKQYRSNADLTRHLRCVHDGVKNYQCDICSRYFASKGTRNDHRRTHTGEKPYICHVCGKSFPTPNSIYVHRRVHTDYFPHSCTNCDKKFRRKQQLVNHFRTHTGEKPHICDVCGKCFCTRDEVSRHKLTHSNEKPHICSACGIRFGQKRYLSNHMKTNHSS